jgi:uncharacterized protein YdeI (BOF family)
VERTRLAALSALFVVLSLGGAAVAAVQDRALVLLAAVTWPPSTLLVSEVQTGGATASDEFAEITNAGAQPVDLAGLEIVYATSTGSTVTRKASWSSSLLLHPGRHLFVANAAGSYAGLADATYAGGFAATGGSIVLRVIGGQPVDAVGWGDATNAFVEGSPAAAPAAGSSLERRPGGIAGNGSDSNDNITDWEAQAAPNPQSLAAPPAPVPVASATPAATPPLEPSAVPSLDSTASPTALPTPIATAMTSPGTPTTGPTTTPSATPDPPAPSPAPTVPPTPAPTLPPGPTPTPIATPIATPEPSSVATPTTAPTAVPTPVSTVAPTLAPPVSPAPEPIVPILQAREQPNGTTARVVGVLTTRLGALEDGRKAFVQDDDGGIALYLDAPVVDSIPPDTQIDVTGSLDDRFAERTLRVALQDIVVLGQLQRPPPRLQQTGEIGETVEGYRVLVQGTTVGSPSEMADGLGLMVDDGSGAVRVIVDREALGGASVPSGTTVVAVGPVGQRDSSGTGLAGYRIHATEESDFGVLTPTPTPTATPAPSSTPGPTASPAPTPRPSASLAPTASPAPTPTPTPTPRPTSTQSPAPTPPAVLRIVEARGAPIGTIVAVSGVVAAEAGRLGVPSLIAISDSTGGIAVRVPDGVLPPARGATVLVKGPLADPYGQLELRPASAGFKVTGQGSLPTPRRLTAGQLGEETEGQLAELVGVVAATPRKGSNGDLTVDFADPAGTPFRVVSDGSSGIGPTDLVKGRTYRLAGIVGQRASRKGALDGYRLHPRDRGDITALASGPQPSGGPTPSDLGTASGGPGSAAPISTALALPDGASVTIEGTVTAGVALLDSSGRRIVVQDRSGAIEVLLPGGTTGPAVGTRLRITGTAGRAWGAPRLGASAVERVGSPAPLEPTRLDRAPAERDEWQLVRIAGTISDVERLGDRWRAEIVLEGGARAPVHGQAGAEIPSTAIVAGRRISVVGIVKRPYPTATDRRFAVLPRNGTDVAVGAAGTGAPTTPLGETGSGGHGRRAGNRHHARHRPRRAGGTGRTACPRRRADRRARRGRVRPRRRHGARARGAARGDGRGAQPSPRGRSRRRHGAGGAA